MNDNRKLVRMLEEVGRIRLSKNFFLRDFLHSEIAAIYGIVNVPNDVDLAVEAGSKLCNELLEPLHRTFGKVCIRSGYRSRQLNELGHRLRLGCASNEFNFAGHIWDVRDADGRMGATATIVIPWFVDHLENGGDWRSMAWWIHDHLPYSYMCFYPKLGAFNLQWREEPEKRILSWRMPSGTLTKAGMPNHEGCHGTHYIPFGFPPIVSLDESFGWRRLSGGDHGNPWEWPGGDKG
jgi:hypothetical protein